MNLRFPNITGGSSVEQLMQIKSYLHQLVNDLNYEVGQAQDNATQVKEIIESSPAVKNTPMENFNSIKALIIKSADIIDAYAERMQLEFNGLYVAQSDYGNFVESTNNAITATNEGLQQAMENIQTIGDTVIGVKAHINSGKIGEDENGVPIFGVEIGQRTEISGEEVFNKYARFTASKLSFYDSNGNEVAYISDNKLIEANVEINGSLKIGHFVDTVMADGSVVRRYKGA